MLKSFQMKSNLNRRSCVTVIFPPYVSRCSKMIGADADLILVCLLTVFVVCRSSWTPCTSTSRGSTSSRRRTTRPRCSTSSPRSSAPSSSSRRSSPPSRPIRTSWWEMDHFLPSLFSEFHMVTQAQALEACLCWCSYFQTTVRTCCLHNGKRYCCGPGGDQVMLWKTPGTGVWNLIWHCEQIHGRVKAQYYSEITVKLKGEKQTAADWLVSKRLLNGSWNVQWETSSAS